MNKTLKAGDRIYVTKFDGCVMPKPFYTHVLEVDAARGIAHISRTVIDVTDMRSGMSHVKMNDEDYEWTHADEMPDNLLTEKDREGAKAHDEALADACRRTVSYVFRTMDEPVEPTPREKRGVVLELKDMSRDFEPFDNVEKPAHYNTGETEVIDILTDLASRYEDPVTSYLVATAGKYLFRAPFKGRQSEDLRKAAWYLDRAVKRG